VESIDFGGKADFMDNLSPVKMDSNRSLTGKGSTESNKAVIEDEKMKFFRQKFLKLMNGGS